MEWTSTISTVIHTMEPLTEVQTQWLSLDKGSYISCDCVCHVMCTTYVCRVYDYTYVDLHLSFARMCEKSLTPRKFPHQSQVLNLRLWTVGNLFKHTIFTNTFICMCIYIYIYTYVGMYVQLVRLISAYVCETLVAGPSLMCMRVCVYVSLFIAVTVVKLPWA